MITPEKMKRYEDMLCRELDKLEMDINKKGEMNEMSLNAMHKITDTIKNLHKIEALEGGQSGRRYSGDGYWEAQGMYDRGRRSHDMMPMSETGDSYERHWVTGHYSRDDSKSLMIERLENLMRSANTEKDRDTIRDTIATLKNM